MVSSFTFRLLWGRQEQPGAARKQPGAARSSGVESKFRWLSKPIDKRKRKICRERERDRERERGIGRLPECWGI